MSPLIYNLSVDGRHPKKKKTSGVTTINGKKFLGNRGNVKKWEKSGHIWRKERY